MRQHKFLTEKSKIFQPSPPCQFYNFLCTILSCPPYYKVNTFMQNAGTFDRMLIPAVRNEVKMKNETIDVSTRICKLRQKEVINCRDGERIGFVSDVEFNLKTGCIENLIVPGPCKIWWILGRDQEFIIPWRCVCRIGFDIILVDVDVEAILVKCDGI